MQIPELNSFYLVGGTSLALRYGHRTSVDIALFSTKEFNNEQLNADLLRANIPLIIFKIKFAYSVILKM